MSVTNGLLPPCATWTLKCDQLRTYLDSLIGLLTLYSDAGTGDSRVLLYSITGLGENHLLKFVRSSSYMSCQILGLDKSTSLLSVNSATNFGYASTTMATMYLSYNNTEGLIITGINNSRIVLLKLTCGAVTKVFVAGSLIVPDEDRYIGLSSDHEAFPKIPTISGKQVLVPAFMYGTSNLNIEEAPIDDVYAFKNKDGVAIYSQVTINSVKFMIWALGNSDGRNHLIRIE